jgi:hypothetical protein
MNLGGELRQRLRGGPWFVVGSDQRHKVEATGLWSTSPGVDGGRWVLTGAADERSDDESDPHRLG